MGFPQLTKQDDWFKNDYIFVPVNEKYTNLTILAIDIKNHNIIFCNPYSSDRHSLYVVPHIWRYLCYQTVISHFSNCGVYVCAVAKSVIFAKSLPAEPNLTTFRLHMAHEIANL